MFELAIKGLYVMRNLGLKVKGKFSVFEQITTFYPRNVYSVCFTYYCLFISRLSNIFNKGVRRNRARTTKGDEELLCRWSCSRTTLTAGCQICVFLAFDQSGYPEYLLHGCFNSKLYC